MVRVGWIVGCAIVGLSSGCGDNLPEPDLPALRCAELGTWTAIPSPGLAGRVDHGAVWTGEEMVVWGGTQGERSPFRDGAVYRPTTRGWRSTGFAPIEPRDDHATVWTGHEMIVWGGNSYDEGVDILRDGGAYDPRTGGWRPLSAAPLSARDDARAAWTGHEMLVWGGRDDRTQTADGAAYDPAADQWRWLAPVGAPEAREDHVAVWTGRELLIWGGWNGDDEARNYALSGRRYDPVADVWRPMSAVGAPQPREDAAAVWTGTELIVWGGVVRDGDPAQRHRLGTGGRYDPVTDTWQPVTLTNAPTPREDAVVVWTGDEMLVWGGRGDDFVPRLGARYVPAADRWCPMASRNAPTAGHDAAGVWTGLQLLVWGGDAALGTGGAYLTGGGAYQPPAASDPAE